MVKMKERINHVSGPMTGMANEIRQDMKLGLDRMDNRVVLGATLGSILLSLILTRRGASVANFVGLWAPTILGMAILFKENKILDLERQRSAFS